MNNFKTILTSSESTFKDKGSKFLAFAVPVKSAEEALEEVKKKRKEFFDARHVCYAYMLGAERQNFRINDDGEPSGTAGKPILGQINSNNLTDILIIVVRYFGGILLGASGLINAYKTAAAEAITNAEIVEIDIEKLLKITCGYDNINFVMKIIKDFDLKILSQNQNFIFMKHINCEFIISCKNKFYENLLKKLNSNFMINFEYL